MLRIDKAEIGHKSTLLSMQDLQLIPGNLYALIGRNGIGKSTFLQTIIGAIPPISGNVLLNEININSVPNKIRAKQVSFVGSTFRGIENLTVFDFLLLGRVPYTNVFGLNDYKDKEVVNTIIQLVSIEFLKSKFTHQLSDGEKQLVAIAQALVQQTKLFVLDEPTAFLDYENKWKIIELLKTCTTENNLCTIFSSHDLEIALETTDNLLLINPVTKKLIQVATKSISKKEVISICFPSL